MKGCHYCVLFILYPLEKVQIYLNQTTRTNFRRGFAQWKYASTVPHGRREHTGVAHMLVAQHPAGAARQRSKSPVRALFLIFLHTNYELGLIASVAFPDFTSHSALNLAPGKLATCPHCGCVLDLSSADLLNFTIRIGW